MYIEHLDSFIEQAEALYKENALKARYTIKYNHAKGVLKLKVTDDRQCIQYKTDQQADLRKIERLNARFFALMATGEDPIGVEMTEAQQPAQQLAQHQNSPQKAAGDQAGSRQRKNRRKG